MEIQTAYGVLRTIAVAVQPRVESSPLRETETKPAQDWASRCWMNKIVPTASGPEAHSLPSGLKTS